MFRVGELHHTVLLCLIHALNSVGIILFECFHRDDLILAHALAGLVIGQSPRVEETALNAFPLCSTSIWTGGTFFARVPKCPWLSALAPPTHTAAPPAADLAVVRHTGSRLCRAITVVSNITSMAFTLTAVAFSMA